MTVTNLPAALYPSDSARTQGQLKQFFEDILQVARELPGSVSEALLTIATGAVTPTVGTHRVDTEGGGATDDLANIVASNMADGRLLFIRQANSARVVTIKHAVGGAGQIHMTDSVDLKLEGRSVLLQLRGTDWYEMMRTPQAEAYIKVLDSKATNTEGGSTSSTTWNRRDLNTISVDETGVVSVSSNKITLPAGKYRFNATVPGAGTAYGQQKLRLVIDPDGTPSYIYGPNCDLFPGGSSYYQSSTATIFGAFTLAASKAIAIEQYVTSGLATYGGGKAINISSVAEIYSVIELRRQS